MEPREPCNLREWDSDSGRLFTCGRPGRCAFRNPNKEPILDPVIEAWLSRLPPADVLHIVSLLGQKTTGLSEFRYYPFRSVHELNPKPTFQEWLTSRYGQQFVVHEFPTVDAQVGGIPADRLSAVIAAVASLLEKRQTVVVVDSFGVVRTGQVCRSMGRFLKR